MVLGFYLCQKDNFKVFNNEEIRSIDGAADHHQQEQA